MVSIRPYNCTVLVPIGRGFGLNTKKKFYKCSEFDKIGRIFQQGFQNEKTLKSVKHQPHTVLQKIP